MKLTSLKLTKKEAKADLGPSTTPVGSAADDNLPKYPYGTKIRLESDALDKLGLEPSDFTTDQVLEITAKVIVTRTEDVQMQGGKNRCELELQITDMGVDTKAIKKKKAADSHLNEISGPATEDADY